MSDQTPPPSEEPESVPTPEPVVYTPPADQPVSYTPAPPVTVPATGTQNGAGTAALIFGILGIIQCIPFIGGILAIVFGRIGINKAKRGEATNVGMARAGFWLGIGGIAVSSVVLGFIFGFALLGVHNLNTNTSPQVNSETGLADGQYQMRPTEQYNLNARCGFTGDAIDEGRAVVASNVTVSGKGITECTANPRNVTRVRFEVNGGVARIVEVQ